MDQTDIDNRLRELIYVDDRRLDSYAEQIGPTTVYDKVPKWTIGASLIGIKVEATQERLARQLSKPEKINAVLKGLRGGSSLDYDRPRDLSYFGQMDKVFRLETCVAVSVRIPARETGDSSFRGMGMWVSENNTRAEPHRLLLIEDFARDDDSQFDPSSGYSTLLALSQEGYNLQHLFERAGVGPFADLQRQKVIADQAYDAVERDWGDIKKGFNLESVQRTPKAQRKNEAYLDSLARLSEEELGGRFANDPVEFFSWLGATIGSRRTIETLYRIRQVFVDSTEKKRSNSIVTIGYPIFIAAASGAMQG
jgi:hypothetical protein